MDITHTQKAILARAPCYRTHSDGSKHKYLPIFGAGEHRSAHSLEIKGFGVIGCAHGLHHATEYFFIPKSV